MFKSPCFSFCVSLAINYVVLRVCGAFNASIEFYRSAGFIPNMNVSVLEVMFGRNGSFKMKLNYAKFAENSEVGELYVVSGFLTTTTSVEYRSIGNVCRVL